MDRFVNIFRHFQSNSESMMNGICGILALASIRIYTTFQFICPCLPIYNTVYGIGVMFLPPTILFLCGIIVNKHSLLMMEEWQRPESGRSKDAAVLRYMFLAVAQRAALAPAVWLIVALLDGKCVVCAFSSSVDPSRFTNMSGFQGEDLLLLLSKVPCKELTADHLQHHFPRKAVYRYLRSVSQALGWSLLFLLVLVGFLARCFKPCSQHVTFLQSRYWSNYIDIEQSAFEQACCDHARGFARHCVIQFFQNMQTERKTHCPEITAPFSNETDHLHGIRNKEQLNNLLMKWFIAKPPLNISPISQQRRNSYPLTARESPQEQPTAWESPQQQPKAWESPQEQPTSWGKPQQHLTAWGKPRQQLTAQENAHGQPIAWERPQQQPRLPRVTVKHTVL
ncbi:calcium homeostasis modulator protein 3-like [Mustelus asterias]